MSEWLNESRFLFCSAGDVFDAIGEIADFTVRNRPEVIMLDVNCCHDDLALVQTMFKAAENESDPTILALSKDSVATNDKGCYQGDLLALAARLETLIPPRTLTH